LVTDLVKRLGHIIMNINSNILAFQTYKVCDSCLISSKRQMKGVHLLNIKCLDMLPINYSTPKLTE
jgi:hypothetical protein